MDGSGVSVFRGAVASVFEGMFGVAVEAKETSDSGGSFERSWAFSGVIGLAGDAKGLLALRFTEATASRLVELSGVALGDDEHRAKAALVAEVSNIVAGNASGSFGDFNLDIAPPVVVYGEGHSVSWPGTGPVAHILFDSALGEFELACCVEWPG